MGYLHEAHLRLIDRAREVADLTVVSVFVNPLQFGPQEDFDRYPRDPERDRALAVERGVDCLFVPAEAAVYPAQPNVRIDPGALAAHLCGPHRPGHFEGVLIVVAKLLHMVEPDVAVFGRKDAQQAIIVQRMVTDLEFSVRVEVVPTVRERDGLALSSRNAYLSEKDRRAAPAIARGLDAAHTAFRSGVTDASRLLRAVRDVIAAQPRFRIEYLEAVDSVSLSPVETAGGDTIIAVGAYLGETRLIDNIVLGEGIAGDPRVEP